MGLTKLDLAALRKADSICFDHDRPRDRVNSQAGRIRCIKRLTEKQQLQDPYGGDERTYTINVDSRISICGNYDSAEEKRELQEKLRAFEMIYAGDFYPKVQTIISNLRVNDVISLKWIMDNNNDYVKNAGLHKDDLVIEVNRDGKQKVKRLEFLVHSSVCEDNSARMIKRYW